MRVVVPFAASEPKTRLEGVLSPDERAEFADAVLTDVLAALAAAGRSPTVLSTAPLPERSVPVRVDERDLSTAVNAVLAEATEATAVVMADLALATPRAFERLFAADGDVVLAPGLGGGTNALVVRDAGFRVDYHGGSFADHRAIAAERGLATTVVDSFRLAVDVDERADLAEVLLHGEGTAAEWLRDRDFTLATADGRVTARRE